MGTVYVETSIRSTVARDNVTNLLLSGAGLIDVLIRGHARLDLTM